MAEPRLLHPVSTKRETAKAAASYAEYAAIGQGRSLEKLAALYQTRTKPVPGLTTLKYWSTTHHWQERVAAYDRQLIEEKRVKRDAALEQMDEEHATFGRSMLIRTVDMLRKRLESGDIGTYALVQLFEKASALERLARGAGTSRTELTGKDGGPIETKRSDIDDLTEEDLRLVRDLAQQLRERKYGESIA